MTALLPLLVGLFLAAMLATSIVALFSRRQHPLRILVRAVSGASVLAIIGVTGILPAGLWWLPWLLTLVLAVAVAFACRRLLAPSPFPAPSAGQGRRRAADLAAPSRSSLVTEGLLYLALLAIGLVAG